MLCDPFVMSAMSGDGGSSLGDVTPGRHTQQHLREVLGIRGQLNIENWKIWRSIMMASAEILTDLT